MIIEDYNKILEEVIDLETEVNSIADTRRLISELKERESILLNLKENLVKDIRLAESNYLKEKAALRDKYSTKRNSGITGMIRGSSKSKLIKELKKLESKSKIDIEDLKELRYLIDDLLVQFNEIKAPLNNSLRQRFGN
jgi:hypothetical protein